MKKIPFLLIIFFCCHKAFTQSTYDEDSAEMVDTSNLSIQISDSESAFVKPIIRQVSTDSMRVLKGEKEFTYMQYIDSFFRHHKFPEQEVVKAQDEENKPGIFAIPGLRIIYWLLAIAAALWIVWKLFMGQGSIFTRNRKLRREILEDESVLQEDVAMEHLIDKAIGERNYRLATRYLYLQTLAMLGEQDMISLAPQKTNYQYIRELKGKQQQQSFSTLTLQYEYAWYGNFVLSASQFEIIHRNFQSFMQTLK